MSWKDNIDNNQQPVIGVFTQTLEDFMQNDPKFTGKKSYVMGAYVRYLQSAGARVIPLL
jgi:hypothetical protein